MKVLFVRPPRYLWPWNSESSSFWQPLGFASMAAVLQENGFDVEILDCLPFHMGWKTLKKTLIKKKFDILCCGDETASAIESVKITSFIKKHKPKVVTIGGGFFFPYLPEASLTRWDFDYIIKGEGEQTLLELVAFLSGKNEVKSYLPKRKYAYLNNLESIKGLYYLHNKKIQFTGERNLVDIDALPFPAYDLLPMHLYGNKSKNHPDFSAIEHGRGCTGGCDFCSITSLFSYRGKCTYRTKSPQRSFEETKLLVKKYGRKTLNWVDGTFNLDPKWSKEYFTLIEKAGIHVNHTTWMRSDCIIRDKELGIMDLMARNGVVQTVVGVERLWENNVMNMKQKDYAYSQKALNILKKYPDIYVIVSLIYGLPQDGRKELKKLREFIYKNEDYHFPFPLPYTPFPCTKLWEKHDFSLEELQEWNFHRPVMGTNKLSREELDKWFRDLLLGAPFFSPKVYKIGFFSAHKRNRRVEFSLLKKIISAFLIGTWDTMTGRNTFKYGKKPRWYDS
jgi:anaerobic magnesium-protoporphyrin IX monomethyl ester cyclase